MCRSRISEIVRIFSMANTTEARYEKLNFRPSEFRSTNNFLKFNEISGQPRENRTEWSEISQKTRPHSALTVETPTFYSPCFTHVCYDWANHVTNPQFVS